MNTLGRAFVVLVICLGLPLLALPKVRQKVEDFLYGKLESVLPPLPPKAEPTPAKTETADKSEDILRLGFDKDVPPPPPLNAPPLMPGAAPHDLSPAKPPQLTPIPVDPASVAAAPAPLAPSAPAAIPGPQVADATMQQIRAIRRQLEDLGAEYILLESVDGGRTYRFHCQMATDARRSQLQPFEAAMTNPLAAAESVLQQVLRWRSAAPQPNGAPRAASPTFSQ